MEGQHQNKQKYFLDYSSLVALDTNASMVLASMTSWGSYTYCWLHIQRQVKNKADKEFRFHTGRQHKTYTTGLTPSAPRWAKSLGLCGKLGDVVMHGHRM